MCLKFYFWKSCLLWSLFFIRYVMQGSNESRCLHDGTWSHPPPLCKGSSFNLFIALLHLFKDVLVDFSVLNVVVFLLAAVNCPLPTPPTDGRIIHDKPVAGTTTMYGQGWTYECNPPKAPSHERGLCMANGSATEPPVCRGLQIWCNLNVHLLIN